MDSELAAVDHERFYSIEEAAEELGVSPSTVRRRVKRGQLVAVQARIAQGYEWRIRLRAEDKTPTPPLLSIRQPLSLEETRHAVAEALAGLVDELSTTRRQLVEAEKEATRLAAENDRLRQRSWWRRLFG